MWRMRARMPQRGVRRIEQDAQARAALAPTVARYDPADIGRALRCAIALYLELRRADPPPTPTAHMPGALLDLIAGAADTPGSPPAGHVR